jgi:hypothetical protein
MLSLVRTIGVAITLVITTTFVASGVANMLPTCLSSWLNYFTNWWTSDKNNLPRCKGIIPTAAPKIFYTGCYYTWNYQLAQYSCWNNCLGYCSDFWLLPLTKEWKINLVCQRTNSCTSWSHWSDQWCYRTQFLYVCFLCRHFFCSKMSWCWHLPTKQQVPLDTKHTQINIRNLPISNTQSLLVSKECVGTVLPYTFWLTKYRLNSCMPFIS